MNNGQNVRVLLLLMGALLLGACASSPRIVSNVDPAADFSRFRSFDFMQPLDTDSASGQTLSSRTHEHKTSSGGTSVRDTEVLDGGDALPDENQTACRD